MKRKLFAATTLAIALALGPSLSFAQGVPKIVHHSHHSSAGWWIMACPSSIILAASAKNWRRHAELTTEEAWTCGLLYWWNESTGKYGY